MYGTVNWTDIDANQNDQHITLQVTSKKLKKN